MKWNKANHGVEIGTLQFFPQSTIKLMGEVDPAGEIISTL